MNFSITKRLCESNYKGHMSRAKSHRVLSQYGKYNVTVHNILKKVKNKNIPYFLICHFHVSAPTFRFPTFRLFAAALPVPPAKQNKTFKNVVDVVQRQFGYNPKYFLLIPTRTMPPKTETKIIEKNIPRIVRDESREFSSEPINRKIDRS